MTGRRWDQVWTRDEYLALPLADEDTRACPNCDGHHFGAFGRVPEGMPQPYRCHGTATPNWEDAPYVPPCGTIFRGRPGDHFNERFYPEYVAGRVSG